MVYAYGTPCETLFGGRRHELSEKRKDNKGRIFRTGEGQRPNGTYFYRYHRSGEAKWYYVYAPTLEEIRQKEETIQRDLLDGIDYSGGEITVTELVDRYLNLRRGLKQNSMRAYGSAVKRIHADPFGQRKIRSVKLSDAKGWFVSLHDAGLKQNTIGIIQSVVRPAFEMAVDDDMIRKNPFKFKLSDVIPNDAYVRSALTKAQQERYLNFILEQGGNYYDDIVILLGTGLRVSELYGLTKADVDLDRRCIHVRRQLCRTADKPYFICPPKTSSGIRSIPMTDTVYLAIQRVLSQRGCPKVEMMVDGYSGFLFLDKDGKPKVAMHLENYMRGIQRKIDKAIGGAFPRVTPHVLRHTFCTNAQQAMLDVKSLQYLMGHSTASVTLDVYTHSDFDSAERAFRQIAKAL
jgi:integrase